MLSTAGRRILLERAGQTIIEHGRRGSLATPQRYPEWTIADLMIHVSRVHRFVTPIIEGGMLEPPEGRVEPPAPNEVEGFFARGLEALLEAFDQADPYQRCWGYGPQPTVETWLRRMALETEVHRWDAASAFGSPQTFDPLVAADGIDELRIMWLPWLKGGPLSVAREGPLVVVAPDDVTARWTISVRSGRLTMDRVAETSAHALLSGTAADIYLFLMGRADKRLMADIPEGTSRILRWAIDHMAEATI